MVVDALPYSLPIVLNAFEHSINDRELIFVLTSITLIAQVQIMRDRAKQALADSASRIAAVVSSVLRKHGRAVETDDEEGMKKIDQIVLGCCVALSGVHEGATTAPIVD